MIFNIDLSNTPELFENSKFYLENIDPFIDLISNENNLPNTQISIRNQKAVNDLKLVKVCSEIYIKSKKSNNWQVSSEMKKDIIYFLRGFKSSENKIEFCKSIDIV